MWGLAIDGSMITVRGLCTRGYPLAGMSTAAIVLAGGSGSRTQQAVNKVYLPIRDRPMLAYSIETFERAPAIDRVVIVIREDDRKLAEQVLSEIPVSKETIVVPGGPTRHRSEMAGLTELAPAIESGEVELVAIHDGARPFLTLDLLEALIGLAVKGGAVPALPVEAPLYRVDGEAVEPLPEESLRRMQTPQVFLARPLLDAYRESVQAGREGVDTAETIERFSDLTVRAVPGDPRNIKVTFIEDFFRAEEWAADWDKGRWTAS